MENMAFETINRAGMIGTQELILILVLAVLLFGGSRISGLGKAMGKSVREFKEEVGAGKDDAKDNVSETSSDKAEENA